MSKPEENNPPSIPENPSHKFQIEVQNVHQIYNLVKNRSFRYGEELDESHRLHHLGNIIIDDGLIRDIDVEIRGQNFDSNDVDREFNLVFNIHRAVQVGNCHNYNSPIDKEKKGISIEKTKEMVKQIEQQRTDSSIQCKYLPDLMKDSHGIEIIKNNQKYIVTCGHRNTDDYVGTTCFSNMYIYLENPDIKSDKLYHHYLRLDNENDFNKIIKDFIEVCQLVTDSIYTSNGENSPEGKFILECPENCVLNQQEPSDKPLENIQVQVKNISQIYSTIKTSSFCELAGSDSYRLPIKSNYFYNDPIFKTFYNDIYFQNLNNNPPSNPSFIINSTISLNTDKQEPIIDFFDTEKLKTIQEILQNFGVKSFIQKRIEIENDCSVKKHSLIINVDKYFFIADFGYINGYEYYKVPSKLPSYEEIFSILPRLYEKQHETPKKYFTPNYSPKYKSAYEPKIDIFLSNTLDKKEWIPMQIPLGNEDEFTEAISAYALLYKQLIDAIYLTEDINPPKSIIALKPEQRVASMTELPSNPVISQEVKRTNKIENTNDTSFSEILGQDDAVEEAKELVLGINHPEIFEKWGIKPSKAILFCGPTGTGKTMLIRAIASEINAEILNISCSEIGTKWYGESERNIQDVFNQANKIAKNGKKAIIVFDELDSLAPSRENVHDQTDKRVVSVILQNLDGFTQKDVLVMATTNLLDNIDKAVLRPGRIDKVIEVGLPNIDGRKKILEQSIKKANLLKTVSHDIFSSDLNIERIAERTINMSGAELVDIISSVLKKKAVKESQGIRQLPITTEDIENIIIHSNRKKKVKIEGFNDN